LKVDPHSHHNTGGREDLSPAHEGHESAVKIQRIIAFLVVVLPFLAVLLSIWMINKNGISSFGVGIFIVMYFLGMLGITVGFHRLFAHRSFETSWPMKVFLSILGSMSAQGPLFFWVATHRRHHAYSDQPGDPHSPQLSRPGPFQKLRGLWFGHIAWMFSKELTNWVKFAPDLMKDRKLFQMHQLYFLWLSLGLLVPALLGWLVTGTVYGALEGFIYGGLVRIFFVNHALWAVGSISHMFGKRPLLAKTKDKSANNYWVALAAFGEGNQNNHHAYPSSAKHGLKWWEPDITYWVIRMLNALRLIWEVNVPSKDEIHAEYQRTNALQNR